MGQKHKPPSPRMQRPNWTQGASNACKKCWEHLVLRTSGQYDGSYDPQFHCHGANKSNGENIGKVHTVIGLPSRTRGRESPIPRIRHDNEYPFRCVVPLRGKGVHQNMRTFFPGVSTKRWRAHLVKWLIPLEHDDPTICPEK